MGADAEKAQIPTLPDSYLKAQLLAQTGQIDEARLVYEQMLTEEQPSSIQALVYSDLAALAAIDGKPDSARELLKDALTADSECPTAAANLQALNALASSGNCDRSHGKVGATIERGCETAGRTTHHRDHAGITPVDDSKRGDLCESQDDRRVKIAIVSAMFNWPSGGGGNIHTVQLAIALRQKNYKVHHFYLKYAPWLIGDVVGNPIGSQAIAFTKSDWSLAEIQARVAAAVKDRDPDFVLLTDSWSLKPWLAEAVSSVPYLLRFDAIECLCPLNNLRVIPHPNRYLEPCTKHRLATPESCLTCVQEHGQFVAGRHQCEREFSGFGTGEYHWLLLKSLANAEAVLVHNPLIAAVLEPYAAKVRVVPIGVDRMTFGEVRTLAAADDESSGIKRILFGGRTTDLIKGFQVLQAAGEHLWQRRQDFRILATGKPVEPELPFIEWKGWQSHEDMLTLLASADIVAAPAVANEPFGLTVVEAMAAARPVVASRVGGQQFTVVDGLTGLLCEPDDPIDLAEKLSVLLDSAEVRVALGTAARRRCLSQYAWEVVIDRHYRPLFRLRSPTSRAVTV